MAYVKVGSHSSATACLTYGEYKDKELREGVVVGGVDCRSSAAKEEFKAVRFLWNKENGVQAHTVIQSFDDDITMDKANEIGQEVAKRLAPGHQAVVFTHNDGEGGKIHNHIVINSVNRENGGKLQSHGLLYRARQVSNDISKELGLNIIRERTAELRYTQAERALAGKGIQPWKDEIREVIDHAKKLCRSVDDFKDYLQQHGITINKATWLFYDNTRMRMFICGAKPEYDYVREYFGYPDDNVKYTGFCRFDDYHSVDVNRKHIVLMPSWREWIGSKNEFSDVFEDTSVFENTEYYRKYQSLINNKKLAAYLKDNDLTLYFYPHRNMQQFIESFSTDCENIRIVSSKEADIRALLMESAVMITDYSSVAIDFAYMKKPVIYYQFDEERFRKAQYEKGYFDYRDSGLGVVLTEEDDVVEELIEIYGNGLEPDAAFLKAHGQFFPLFDDNNCERVYEAIKSIYR